MTDDNKLTIGYTTGVFDLFHVGHLNLLKNARLQCDKLIVGVYSDDIVASYKESLPTIPHNERMEIVSAIRFVDQVVSPATRDDKLAEHKLHKFNIYFIGSDWSGTDRWNKIENDFLSVGVRVLYLPYTTHISSAAIKKRIIQSGAATKTGI